MSTLVLVTKDGSCTLAAVAPDPASAIVGSWYSNGPHGYVALTFLEDGTYVNAEDGINAPGWAGTGIELGSYTWNPSTGALGTSIAFETNEEGGLSHPPSANVQVSGDTMTVDGALFTRAAGPSAILGGWYGENADGDTLALTFLQDGTYLIAEHDLTIWDTGYERGTYSWDALTGSFTNVIAMDTNGVGGLSGAPVLAAFVIPSVVEGDELDNVLVGGNERDAVLGRGGNDSLAGLGGDDFLNGGTGSDTLDGGAGADTLEGGGAGADWMAGGAGDDLYFVDDAADVVYETLHAGESDTVIATVDFSIGGIANLENLRLGWGATYGAGNDLDNKIVGSSWGNILSGAAGNDSILGLTGHDTLQGNQGNDTLRGGRGDDELRGGQADDVIYSGDGSDRMFGGLGNDVLRGTMGNDTIYGGQGNDTLFGGADYDFLQGHLGNDALTGGRGPDTFWFSTAGAADADTILDFVADEDTIQLDPGFFSDPSLVVYDGASGELSYAGQLVVTLAGNPGFTDANLLFA